jgi:hypothetical protein
LTKAPKTDNGEKTASSTNVTGKTEYLPAKKIESRYMFVALYKYQQNWIKDLNIRTETLKPVQKKE